MSNEIDICGACGVIAFKDEISYIEGENQKVPVCSHCLTIAYHEFTCLLNDDEDFKEQWEDVVNFNEWLLEVYIPTNIDSVPMY